MPKLVVIAGPNGSGKSTIAPALLKGPLQVLEFVNADTLAKGLSGLAPERAAFSAGKIMLKRLRELVDEKADFAFETTLASRTFAPWITDLKNKGYFFHLIYLWLPTPELAIERVNKRTLMGEHSIPIEVIRRRYERSLYNFFRLYRPLADSWLLLENSDEQTAIAWRNIGGPLHVKTQAWQKLKDHYE